MDIPWRQIVYPNGGVLEEVLEEAAESGRPILIHLAPQDANELLEQPEMADAGHALSHPLVEEAIAESFIALRAPMGGDVDIFF